MIVASHFLFDSARVPSVHASTILQTRRGLLAAFFGGTGEGHPDVCIWLSRFENGKWSELENVASGNGFPTWNPVLFQPRNGPVMLFYKAGQHPHSWWGMLKTSDDDGRTWSEARRLPEGILGPIKNKPVQLANGDILSPTSVELGDQGGWQIYFERSTDNGKTWAATPHVVSEPHIDAIQPSILIHSEKQLQALGRTRSGRMYETWSEDAGKSWSKLSLIDLPNPNSGTDAVTLKDRTHLLIYNHSCTEKARYPLNIAMSRDGQSWNAAAILETEPPGQYSYPAVIQTTDGLVHITYTWKRLKIRHIVVDASKLASVPIACSLWPRGVPVATFE